MRRKEYGNTGKMVTPVGFGAMRFIKEDYTNNKEKCADLVKYAYSKGINYFDTAPRYCEWQSEVILGMAFQEMKRDDIVISTKVMADDSRNAENTYEIICHSLETMKIDKLDICHIWSVKTFPQMQKVMSKGGVYEGMLKAKEEGLIDVISFSTHMGGDDIARAAKEYGDKFSGVLLGYNAMNYTYREAGINAFADLGKGIVIMNPLGGGLIPQNKDKFVELSRNGDPVILSALKFLTSQSRITTVLSGMTSKEEVDLNVQAAENLYDEAEIMEEIATHSVKCGGFNEVCTLCSYCNYCPVGISPHKMMFAYNQKIMGNGDQGVLNQFNWHFSMDPRESRKCIGCKKCEQLCTQKLPIVERIKDIQRIIADLD